MRVETTDAFADVLLTARLTGTALAPADRALVTRLVYGTLAWQGRIDHHLGPLLRTRLEALDPPVRAALRLGLYQLRFLDRVPAYAAVDASVELARARGAGAAGLVNAVLRRAASEPEAPLPRDPIARLAVEWSHPRWLVERWAAEFGVEELPALLAANNVRGPTVIRTNRLRTSRDRLLAELQAERIEAATGASDDAIVIERGAARLQGLSAWRAGHFAFQGEASQLIAPLLGLAAGTRVLDACAAPGGKAAHAAALLGGSGLVLAVDQRRTGTVRIATEATRLGAANVHVLVGDARRPPLRQRVDAALVDAPCSGFGTLRRHPEVRWRRRPEDVARLAALQLAIMDGVAPFLGPGGVLVYAVCTFTREENEDVVTRFHAAHPRFVVERVAGSEAPPTAVTAAGFLRTLPHRHGLDGFFAARLRARS